MFGFVRKEKYDAALRDVETLTQTVGILRNNAIKSCELIDSLRARTIDAENRLGEMVPDELRARIMESIEAGRVPWSYYDSPTEVDLVDTSTMNQPMKTVIVTHSFSVDPETPVPLAAIAKQIMRMGESKIISALARVMHR